MRRLVYIFVWFLGITLLVKMLFLNQSLGYFWFVIAGLSIFFGLSSVRKIKIGDDCSQQVTAWLNEYKALSYYKKNIYINETVKKALASHNQHDALKFVKTILDAEPDNETALGLLISIWGTEIVSEYDGKSSNSFN